MYYKRVSRFFQRILEFQEIPTICRLGGALWKTLLFQKLASFNAKSKVLAKFLGIVFFPCYYGNRRAHKSMTDSRKNKPCKIFHAHLHEKLNKKCGRVFLCGFLLPTLHICICGVLFDLMPQNNPFSSCLLILFVK